MTTTTGKKAQHKIGQINLGDKGALLNEEGKGQFISLLRRTDEENFKKVPWHYIGNNNLMESLAKIKNYNIASDYRRTFLSLNNVEISYLCFIGRFASVLYPQIITEHLSFTDVFGKFDQAETDSDLSRLYKWGLIEKYKYFHPILQENISFYTLSGDGFRLLQYVYGSELKMLHPNMFYQFKDSYNIRFWQVIDLYEAINELPGLAKYSTFFVGTEEHHVPMSPLQFSLEISHNTYRNYIVYSMLQTDKLDYYQRLLLAYYHFQEEEKPHDTNQLLKGFPDGEIVLVFYVPTIASAKRMVQALGVALSRVKFQFIISIQIKNAGFDHAFYEIEQDDNGVNQLVNKPMPNIQNISYYSHEDLSESVGATDDQ
ncbi:hypothetical protein [Lactiplantibacillus plantarum]|uniref:hypothetical protein n=1 Tax=Lactiplantibacillus plantarum TaxID=1590 RepID=UPI001BA5ABB6|nr:hypothetical protein [Lactiplantibacillus plantarum]MBS0954964.1 hypothetical protein [Lactiplantibacillus plantarum]